MSMLCMQKFKNFSEVKMAGYKRKNDIEFLMNMGYAYKELESLSDDRIMKMTADIKEIKTVINEAEASRFADSFQLLRLVVGTSLADISAATEILSINLSRYERGLFEPTLTIAQLIAKYFETTINDMVTFNYNLECLIKIKQAFCASHGKPVEYFPNKKGKVFNLNYVTKAIDTDVLIYEGELDKLSKQFLYFKEFHLWRDEGKYSSLLSEEFLRKIN